MESQTYPMKKICLKDSKKTKEKHKGAEKPISLYPLGFEDAMKAILQTPHESKRVSPKKQKEKKGKQG